MAATRIIIRPNYLFGRGLILFVLSRARTPKSLSSDDSPRSIIIEMTIIHCAGQILTPATYSMVSSRDFSTRRIMPSCSVQRRGAVHTRVDKKKREDWGHGWKASREIPRIFGPARLLSPFLSVFRIYACPTGNRPERCVRSENRFSKISAERYGRKTSLYQFDRDKSYSEADWLLERGADRSLCVISEKVGQYINANQTSRL